MPTSLLSTKLHAPQARPGLVRRPRLTGMLAQGICGPLTLVAAPAGSGKTTLMGEWLADARGRGPVAWVSLDPADNDPLRFLAYLTAAIEAARPGLIRSTVDLLRSSRPPDLEIVTSSLIASLNALPGDLIVALDDYHVIASLAVHDLLNDLLAHASPCLHLVILTRVDPPLPLARLRVSNALTEIRANDLRFTVDEGAAFLSQTMGLSLSREQIALLETRTEGWIAGLQLAALSMRGRQDVDDFVAAFTGSHHYVVDYLVEEVLSRQSEKTRDFLLQTSILERMTAPLCNALTGNPDGQATLAELERANLFLVNLDSDRQWYRYHHLFGEVLRRRLLDSDPEAVKELHSRASEWMEQNGFLQEAVRHALAGGDRDRAGRLLETMAAGMLFRGELVALLGQLEAAGELVSGRPRLCLDRAWALMLTGQLDEVEADLERVEGWIARAGPAEEVQYWRGSVAAIRCYLYTRSGDPVRGLELGRQALEMLPGTISSIRSVLYLTMGGAYTYLGEFSSAMECLQEASRLGTVGGNVHAAVTAISAMANLLMIQGKLHGSQEMYLQALPLAARPDGQMLPIAARVYAGLSRLSYEWNDLETAQAYAQQSFDLGQRWGNVDALVMAHVMLSRIRQAQAGFQGAEEALQAAEQLLRTRKAELSGAEWVAKAHVSLWLAQGDLEACERWLLSHPGQDGRDAEEEFIRARILLAKGEQRKAMQLLTGLLRGKDAAGHTGSVIELLVFQALASSAGDPLHRAVSLARPEGYVRVFLDQGEPLRELLRNMAATGSEKEYVHMLLAAFENEPASASRGVPPVQAEILSPREREVLQLIAAGASNKRIAGELVIAIGTVKRHTVNIFNKLGVENRMEAAAKAREMGLL